MWEEGINFTKKCYKEKIKMTELTLNNVYEVEGQEAIYITRIPDFRDQYGARAMFLSINQDEPRVAVTRSIEFRNLDLKGNVVVIKKLSGIAREYYREQSENAMARHLFSKLETKYNRAFSEERWGE